MLESRENINWVCTFIWDSPNNLKYLNFLKISQQIYLNNFSSTHKSSPSSLLYIIKDLIGASHIFSNCCLINVEGCLNLRIYLHLHFFYCCFLYRIYYYPVYFAKSLVIYLYHYHDLVGIFCTLTFNFKCSTRICSFEKKTFIVDNC